MEFKDAAQTNRHTKKLPEILFLYSQAIFSSIKLAARY